MVVKYEVSIVISYPFKIRYVDYITPTENNFKPMNFPIGLPSTHSILCFNNTFKLNHSFQCFQTMSTYLAN